RHVGGVVVLAAGITKNLDRLLRMEAVAVFLVDRVAHLPQNLAAQLLELRSREIVFVGATDQLVTIGPRGRRRRDQRGGGKSQSGHGGEAETPLPSCKRHF